MFNVTQLIGGLTYSDYTVYKESIDAGFAATAAESMLFFYADGVTPDTSVITITNVEQATTRRRLLETSSGLYFYYDVEFVVGVNNDFTSAKEGYNEAVDSLYQSITDLSFQDNLQSSSPALESATATQTPLVSEPTQTIYVPGGGSSGDSEALDGGAIAGIVIGVLVGSGVLGVAGFYWWREQEHKRLLTTISSTEWRQSQFETMNPLSVSSP